MHQDRSFIGIIPARGGSKRLSRKNVLDLAGKPLISWTIEAALGCPFLDEVMVTTDDDEIAVLAKRFGASVPFLRPSALASDTATSFEAVKHTIDYYQSKLGKRFDFVVLLQPTSPLRNASNISEAIELLSERNADAVISVCEVDHSPLWMNTLPSDNSMAGFIREDLKNRRSQDIEKYFRLNGAIYICCVEVLLAKETFLPDEASYAYPMSREDSVDIDTRLDFLFAESILENK